MAQPRETQPRRRTTITIAHHALDRITQGPTEAQFRPGSIGAAALG